ncbi:MAG: hypothetical protein CYG60_03820 [Actinobacteria bacterium]|nr:MAG: hypothetical protein CYG60_03820 [Actinomycetota bacterium]
MSRPPASRLCETRVTKPAQRSGAVPNRMRATRMRETHDPAHRSGRANDDSQRFARALIDLAPSGMRAFSTEPENENDAHAPTRPSRTPQWLAAYMKSGNEG